MEVYEFADFRLDSRERVLYRAGTPVQLAPKALETLLVLVENHGHIVSKNELMREVWKDTFVEENNLTQYVFALRHALGEKSGGAKFIETVPRRGYRFTAEVRHISSEETRDSEEKGIEDDLKAENKFSGRSVETTNASLPEAAYHTEPFQADSADSQTLNRKIRFADRHRRWKGRFLLASIGLLLAVLLTVSFFWRAASKEKSWSPENIKITRLTESGNLFGADISPDGNSFAYILREGKNTSLRLKNIATDSEIVLVPANEDFKYEIGCFSPDGNYIYYKRRKGRDKFEIFRIPVFGGEARKIADNTMSNISVSPDGGRIAFARQILSQQKHQIVIAPTTADGSSGSSERVVAERLMPDLYHLWSSAPVWSPDGKTLIVTANSAGDTSATRLIEINVETGREREIKPDKSFYWINYMARLNPDELIIAAQENKESNLQLWRVRLANGETARVTNDFNDYLTVRMIPGSNRIIAEQEIVNDRLWLFDSETGQSRQLTAGENRHDGTSGLSFAPDGKIIYTAVEKDSRDIYELNPETGEKQRLTKHAGSNRQPVVSPDGRFIAFVSDRSGGAARLWIMQRDGSSPRRLTQAPIEKNFSEGSPIFSPDGRWIYYLSVAYPVALIYKVPVDGDGIGGEPIKVTPEAKGREQFALSADGKYLVFRENVTDDQVRIAVASTDDGTEKYYDFDSWGNIGWLPDSSSLIVISNGEGNNLMLYDLKTGATRQITNFLNERTNRFAVSPHGTKFAISRGNDIYNAVLVER